MKSSLILIGLFTLIMSNQVIAGTKCFIAKEGTKTLLLEGTCAERASPCSTFKIPLSLMAYNEKMLQDATHPLWPYQDAYAANREVCQAAQNPTNWMQNSCIWFSQVITEKLGMPKFKDYVSQFHYGNQDLSGDPGENNGLSRAWLTSSLKISPDEQIAFLEKLSNTKLPVSVNAQEQTKTIMFIEELPHAWKLYGKTGSGALIRQDISPSEGRQIGWFVGWLQKGERKIIFAHYIEDESKEATAGGVRARDIAKEKLLTLIKE